MLAASITGIPAENNELAKRKEKIFYFFHNDIPWLFAVLTLALSIVF